MKFITFSRQLGTGGDEIAMQVADKLGYKFHDTESISHAAREMGFLDSVVENEKGRIRAEGVVRGVKGVEAVDNQIRVRPGDRHA